MNRNVQGESQNRVTVAVSVVTFNHEHYIAETLNGILSQVGDFDLKIHVSDDGSTDSTPEILREFMSRFPETITVHFHSRKLGIRENFIWTISQCEAEYVAICDGDDLWTVPDKLAQQIAVLEEDHMASLSFHSADVVSRSGNRILTVPQPTQTSGATYNTDDLLKNQTFFATSSIVFRRIYLPEFPKWFQELQNITDLPLTLELSLKGHMVFINRVMSLYRTNSGPHAYTARSQTDVYGEEIQLFSVLQRSMPERLGSRLRQLRRRSQALFHLMSASTRARRAHRAWAEDSPHEQIPLLTRSSLTAVYFLMNIAPGGLREAAAWKMIQLLRLDDPDRY